ncbi:hypothetical protein B7P43_G01514 [Cryptotermes secundus]|uniref:Potassium channel domain-containing protein n=1 Tax=Cryptotermes secundus TaxID=105785 RepID=A0A2J7RES4_9NEOP|nr:uncharacterized protein LOC111861543 isoform X2 [Cryptotermes secundus]PNF39339.1 hypothetical protein B7P43_G01514 [Cryptotermes secundus]
MLEEPEDVAASRCSTLLRYTWKICTCLFSHVTLVSLVVSYCIMGAFTFQNLEAHNEIKVKRNISRIRFNVTEDLWILFQTTDVLKEDTWTAKVRDRLKVFEQELLRSMKSDGWDGTEDENVVQWSFAGALFYSIIVITTIGYGHIAPKTQWGKVVTIFYAILGIPMMLLCLSNIGDIMAQSFRFLYWRVCCYVCTRKPKKGHSRRGRSLRGSSRQPGYYDDGDRDLAMMSRGMHSNRASQHSRFSDTVLQVSSHGGAALEQGSDDILQGLDTKTVPVLSNRYAIERDEAADNTIPRRANSTTADKDGGRQPHYLAVDMPPPPPPLPPSPAAQTRDSLKSSIRSKGAYSGSYSGSGQHRYHGDDPRQPSPCRARIMSPMGFAISRQQSQRQLKSSRLSRLREDADYDDSVDYFVDYDYDDYGGGQSSRSKPVPIWLCVFLVVTYILCGAFLFSKWEKWEFLDSAYFCFITLTTIGFGDFVPAKRVQNKDATVSIALCSLYLLFGIALLAMSFNLVQEEVINTVKQVAKRLGIVKDNEEDEE